MTTFSEKLEGWLVQQPEYPVLFLADRPSRRRAARSLAKQVLTIPTREAAGPNRASRRKTIKVIGTQVGKANAKVSKRRARLLAKAQRDAARYARMSDERKQQLIQAELSRQLAALAEGAESSLDHD